MPHRTTPLEKLALSIVSCESMEALLPDLAAQFAEVAGADLSVVRIREGDQLATRATHGLRSSGHGEHTSQDTELDQLPGPLAEAEGVKSTYAVAFPPDSPTISGVILLGWRSITELDPERRDMLRSMSVPLDQSFARLRAIRERDQAIREAERALALRDEILGVVAHDLRNPLNVITTAVDLLQTRLTDPAQRRHLDRVVRSVHRADRLVRDLLEVNAIEGQGLSLDKKPVEVVEIVLSAMESQHLLASNASVTLDTDLSPELPTIEADELRIQEVLENLISNAIKFTAPGGSVVVGASAKGDQLKVWVHDTGTGIQEDHLPHVFDRFWQGVKRDRRGSGLGLSICRAIIDGHGGRIWAESSPGVGTTMTFTLPVAPAPRPVETAAPVNVLLVDDRPENLIALSAILADPKYRLVTATSGTEALREALREDFAVALIDVAMPGMDGLEVAAHLKKLSRYREIPILFVTAFGDDPEEIHRAYAAGGADYIVKPLDPEVVRKKVAVFVELAKRTRVAS